MALVGNISGSEEHNHEIGLTGSVKIGRPQSGAPDRFLGEMGADVVLYISGAKGGKDSSSGDTGISTTVIGGDLVVSGNTYFIPVVDISGESLVLDHVGSNVHFFISGVNGVGLQDANTGLGGSGAILLGGDTLISGALVVSPSDDDGGADWQVDFGSPDVSGSGIKFIVSGAVGLQGDGETNGQGEQTVVFMGDTVVSGSLTVGERRHDTNNTSWYGGTISGSIHHTEQGLSYLVAGSNVTVTSASNGQLTIASTGGGGSGSGDAAAQYVVLSATGSLSAERVLTAGTGIDMADAGAGNAATLSIDNDIVATVSGTAFTGPVTVNELGGDNDFRVESDTREYAMFVDASTDQVLLGSVGAVTMGADVGLYVSGAIDSVSQTAGSAAKGATAFGGDVVVSGTLTAVRSGDGAHAAVKIDKDYTGTTSVGNFVTDASGLLVDYDVTGIVASGQTAVHDAIAVNYNQGAVEHVGTINATGADIRMSGSIDGAQSMKGVAISLIGADTHIGVDVTAPNDSTHFIARSPDNVLDHFKISVGESGATTLSTSDQGASVGNLTLDADGKIIIEAVAGNEVVFNEGDNDVDFRVESVNNANAIFVDASTDQVLLGSVGTITMGGDVGLYISGAIGSVSQTAGSAAKGATVIGGDLAVSGALYLGPLHTPIVGVNSFISGSIQNQGAGDIHEATSVFGGDLVVSGVIKVGEGIPSGHGGGISGSIQQTAAGLSYLVAGENVTVASGTNGQITISGAGSVDTSGTPADNQIAIWTDADTLEGTSTLTYDGTTIHLNDAVTVNEVGGDNDFRVETATREYAIFVDAGADQILLGSVGTVAMGGDVGLYISGAIDSVGHTAGHAAKGAAAFGGDVVVSGNFFVGPNSTSSDQIGLGGPLPGEDIFLFVSGNAGGKYAGDGTTLFGGDVAFSGTIAGAGGSGDALSLGGWPVVVAPWWTTNPTAGVGGDATLIISGNVNGRTGAGMVTAMNSDLVISGSLVGTYDGDHGIYGLNLKGSPVAVLSEWGTTDTMGSDVGVFLSGSIGSHGSTNSRGTVEVTGDMFVSGGLQVGTQPGATTNGSSENFSVNTENYASRLLVDGEEDQVIIGAFGDNGTALVNPSDILFHVSGAVNPLNENGYHSNVACFNGDIVSSGTIFGAKYNTAYEYYSLDLMAGAQGQGSLQMYAGGARLEGWSATGGPQGSDIYFSVSGSVGSKNYGNSYGVTCFGGDLHVSGGMYLSTGVSIGKSAASHNADSTLTQNTRGGMISLTTNGAISDDDNGSEFQVNSSVVYMWDVIQCSTSTQGLYAYVSDVNNGNFKIRLFNYTGGTIADDTSGIMVNWIAL